MKKSCVLISILICLICSCQETKTDKLPPESKETNEGSTYLGQKYSVKSSNGEILETGYKHNSKKNGLVKTYNSNGELELVYLFVNGKKLLRLHENNFKYALDTTISNIEFLRPSALTKVKMNDELISYVDTNSNVSKFKMNIVVSRKKNIRNESLLILGEIIENQILQDDGKILANAPITIKSIESRQIVVTKKLENTDIISVITIYKLENEMLSLNITGVFTNQNELIELKFLFHEIASTLNFKSA
jgi:antitoxin component YwqK of YwqJK toxin-antitoxin module